MTLEQQRAAKAFEHVQKIKVEASAEDRDRYGSTAQKLPVLIRTAGLCQALHFVRSRNGDIYKQLLNHLGDQLHRANPAITDGETLCEQSRKAELQSYLWLSREALASAEWYARLAQSELGVARGTEATPT